MVLYKSEGLLGLLGNLDIGSGNVWAEVDTGRFESLHFVVKNRQR